MTINQLLEKYRKLLEKAELELKKQDVSGNSAQVEYATLLLYRQFIEDLSCTQVSLQKDNTPAKNKKFSEMTDEELLAFTEQAEEEAKDPSLWIETYSSAVQQPAREQWAQDNMCEVSIPMATQMIEVLKAASKLEGISLEALIKKWLHERLFQLSQSRQETKATTKEHKCVSCGYAPCMCDQQ